MATYSSILAWEISWTEEPGGMQSVGSQRVRYDLVNKQQQQISYNTIHIYFYWFRMNLTILSYDYNLMILPRRGRSI